ncbi:MAG: hypothetical protein ACPGR8_10310 [Limisphaerales bacterium]
MASVECTTNLGNQNRVQRVQVGKFDSDYGRTNAPMISRGTTLRFTQAQPRQLDNGDTHMQFRKSKKRWHPYMAIGVLAEGVADNRRRQSRKGQRPQPFVVPVTFQGVDIATSEQPIQVHFAPGDPVYLVGSGVLSDKRGVGDSDFLGICNATAPPGSFNVQLRVDSLEIQAFR